MTEDEKDNFLDVLFEFHDHDVFNWCVTMVNILTTDIDLSETDILNRDTYGYYYYNHLVDTRKKQLQEEIKNDC
jgi:hypothetical protein